MDVSDIGSRANRMDMALGVEQGEHPRHHALSDARTGGETLIVSPSHRDESDKRGDHSRKNGRCHFGWGDEEGVSCVKEDPIPGRSHHENQRHAKNEGSASQGSRQLLGGSRTDELGKRCW